MDPSHPTRGLSVAGELLRNSELFRREFDLLAQDPSANLGDAGLTAVLEEAAAHLFNAGEVLRCWRIRRSQ